MTSTTAAFVTRENDGKAIAPAQGSRGDGFQRIEDQLSIDPRLLLASAFDHEAKHVRDVALDEP